MKGNGVGYDDRWWVSKPNDMRTIITSAALVAFAAVFAQEKVATPPQQVPDEHVKSIYNECLLTAGTSSWQALGLNSDQMTRITELQTRYQQSVKAAEAKALADEKASAKAKGKAQVKKAANEATPPASGKQEAIKLERTEGEQTQREVEPSMKDSTATVPPVGSDGTLDKQEEFSATTGTQEPVEYSPLDTELRAILTPSQLALWERRCNDRASNQR